MSKKAKDSAKKISLLHENPLMNLTYALLSGLMTYGFGSWAIDSGSWWHYIFTILSLYYTAHFVKMFIVRQFKSNDKRPNNKRKTRKS